MPQEGLFEGHSDGGFAAGREAGQPDCVALLAAEGGALGGRHVGGVKSDISEEERC